jgi:pimeloyl-ACP methyl ester carboxylesterase
MYVKESGPPDAASIVFLHGGGLAGWMWDKQVEEFSDFHCLIPDLPEHGESTEEAPFSIADAADKTAELIRSKAAGGKAHVVGVSLGAQIIVSLLSRSPEVVDHAIIVSALVRRMPLLNKLTGPMVRISMPLVRRRWFAKLQAKSLGIRQDSFETYFLQTKQLKAETIIRLFNENLTFGLPGGLDRAKSPTLILAGERELVNMLKSAKDLSDAIAGSDAYIIAGASHNFCLESPHRVNQIVRAWIEDRPLPAGLIRVV